MAAKATKAVIEPVVDTTSEVPPSALRLYGRNPRKGNVAAVAASLLAHGQFRPVTANIGTYTRRSFEVLAGNHTVKAFRQLAQEHPTDERWNAIKVHWVDVDESQAATIVLADNRTAELGSYDNTALAGLLKDVAHDLTGLGYSSEDLDAIASFTEIPPDDPEPPTPSGRGQMVISYAIVFDTVEQKRTWLDFTNWLKRRAPDNTLGERLSAYLHDLSEDLE